MTLSESVDVMVVGPFATLGSAGSSRLLLRGGMRAFWVDSPAISGTENNDGSPEGISTEALGRR